VILLNYFKLKQQAELHQCTTGDGTIPGTDFKGPPGKKTAFEDAERMTV
jgi:hypothetical protein